MDTGFHKENIKFFEHFGISEESGIPKRKIALILDDKYKDNPNAQQTFILSSNLLARLFVNIDFIIPKNTRICSEIEKDKPFLGDYILSKAVLIFSKGIFKCKSSALNFTTYDGVLMVGYPDEKVSNLISIISNGWNIYLNKINVISQNYNSIGACAASCIGSAELFKYVLRPKGCRLSGEMSFSLLNYNTDIPEDNPTLSPIINIGEVTLVGAGAIGSAIIYGLKCLDNLEGKLDIVDGDRYSNGNINRYIIADETTVSKYKIDISKMLLNKHPKLKVNGVPLVYDDYKKEKPQIDTLLVAVDKRITRYNIQSEIPRLIFDAATTDSSIDLARIDFGTGGACLGCLYKPDQKDNLLYQYISENLGLGLERVKYLYNRSEGLNSEDTNIISNKLGKDLTEYIDSPIDSVYQHEICGSGKLKSTLNNEEFILAPISFISAFAGILVVCELVKDRYYPQFKVNNHFLMDMFKVPNPSLHNFKSSNTSCLYCNDDVYLEVYERKWG